MKRKLLIKVLIVILLIYNMIPASNLYADPMDVCGIDSGKYYYIRNVDTGKYLNCTNSGASNASDVTVAKGVKVARQRWAVNRQDDGTYVIRAVVSKDKRVLDISGQNVDVWTNLNISTQKFNLVRTSEGTYYIKNKNKYVVDSSNDARISSSSTKGEWSFEEVTKLDADIFGFKYPDSGYAGGVYNSTTPFALFKEGMEAADYTPYSFTNTSALTGYTNMKMDSIWAFIGHGVYTSEGKPMATIFFSDSTGDGWHTSDGIYRQYITANQNIINRYAITSYNVNQLASCKCVIYLGCGTNIDYQPVKGGTKYNLVDETFNKGAHLVIGTNGKINTLTTNTWFKYFCEQTKEEGITFEECLERVGYYIEGVRVVAKGDIYARVN